MGYSIYKINFDTQEHTILYDCICDIYEADLLAQLAMCNKTDVNDLIFIAAGWNRSINQNAPKQYQEALELAIEYKSKR